MTRSDPDTATLVADMDPRQDVIPVSHLDLLDRPLLAALTTLLPDGQPQTQPVWYDFDGQRVFVNTMRGFRKERNMRRDPRVTLLVIDPDQGTHWVELRGQVRCSSARCWPPSAPSCLAATRRPSRCGTPSTASTC